MSIPVDIADRKQSHFDLCAHQDAEFHAKTTWLEDVELVYQPLTETALEEIDLGVTVLSKRLDFPVIITGTTSDYRPRRGSPSSPDGAHEQRVRGGQIRSAAMSR